MTDTDGTSGFNGNNVTGTKLDSVVLYHGSTLPTAGTNIIPQYGLFLKTDTGIIYENTGSLATPSWTARSSAGGQSGDQVYPLNTTIGSYSFPSSAVASSNTLKTSAVSRLSLTAGGTDVGLTATTVRGFANIVQAGHAMIGQTINKITMYLKNSMTGTATFGVWNSSNVLVFTFGTLDLSTITASYVGYTKTNSNHYHTVASGDRIGVWFSGSNTSTNIRRNNASVDANLNGGYPSDGQVWSDAGGTQDCDMVLEFEDYYSAYDSLDTSGDNWRSQSEANPNIYYDMGSAKDIAGLLINIDKTNTTETEFEIRFSTDITFTSPEVMRTLLVSNFTDDVDRFITIPRLSEDKRYFQIYGKTGSAVTLALNYVKYIAQSDWDRKSFHKYLDPTSTSATSLDSN